MTVMADDRYVLLWLVPAEVGLEFRASCMLAVYQPESHSQLMTSHFLP